MPQSAEPQPNALETTSASQAPTSQNPDAEAAPVSKAHGSHRHGETGNPAISNLRAATIMLSRRLRYQHAPGELLSPAEAAVLGRLQHGPLTPGQLAKAEHVRPPSMTQTIARLEARGFVRRDPHPDDGRQTFVTPTPAGDVFVQKSRELRTAWLTAQFAQLSEADQRAIEQASEALLRLAELP